MSIFAKPTYRYAFYVFIFALLVNQLFWLQARAGVIEDILKYEAALKSEKKQVVCDALTAELSKAKQTKQKKKEKFVSFVATTALSG